MNPALKPVSTKEASPQLTPKGQPSRLLVIFAFAAIYLIWGSTYLAIRYAIETLPPFLMAATRFLIAGAFLFTWASFRENSKPAAARSFLQWRRAFVIGALLLLCGNGGVTWAEKYLASGLAALVVATEPLWVVVLNWGLDHKRPNSKVLLGVVIGLVGVGLLVGGGGFNETHADPVMSFVSAGVVFAASLAWAGGSVYSNRRPVKASTSMASGMQMLTGGVLLLLVGLITGEFGRLDFSHTSWLSIGALCYLTVFGSIVAFTAYSWLLHNVSPTRSTTYAYVNPVVAVLLGWLLASEPFTKRMLVAAVIIVGSVALITTYGKEKNKNYR